MVSVCCVTEGDKLVLVWGSFCVKRAVACIGYCHVRFLTVSDSLM